MKLRNRSEEELQILYMDHWNYNNSELLSLVKSIGAIGIRNFSSANSENRAMDHGEDCGIRIGLKDLTQIPADLKTSLIVVPLTDSHMLEGLDSGRFRSFSQPVFIEVGSAHTAMEAERTGACAVIVKGNEGPGWVSERNGFVLLQEVLQATSLPVYLQGGVNPRTAAAAISAGAKGVVLDVHLALCRESGLDDELKRFFMQLDGPITSCFCETARQQLRIYSRVGARLVRELRKEEEKIEGNDLPPFMDKLRFYVEKTGSNPDKEDFLVPMSEDISIAREYERQGLSAAQIIEKFSEAMTAEAQKAWPFPEGSEFCKEREIQFPIVQGPMAHISDTPEFLGAVHKAGAAPVLALGNMPREIAQRALEDAKEATEGNFGVGIIGLEVNRHVYESHLEIMEKDPPKFAILAAGNVELAQKIESMGIHCYLHTPSPVMLEQALKHGHRRFVIEGCESGGHVGLMGSLTLWAQSLDIIGRIIRDKVKAEDITVLLAGGIGGPIGAAFVGGMVGDLAEKGLKVGLQIGTKYLATKEAVDTGAITEAYQGLILNSKHTVILGRTVNTRARAAGSPMADKLVSLEMERLRQGLKIRERKELYEQDNLGALRLAAKGCKIDPKTAGGQCPIFMEIPSEEQVDQGLYLMGQVACLCDRTITMAELHRELTFTAREIFQENLPVASKRLSEIQKPHPNTQKQEPASVVDDLKEDPIAVVGLGLRLPGSSTPSEYWEQIINLRSGIVEAPDERWKGVGLFYDPDPKAPDKSYSKIGGFITDFTFDPLERRIPPSVAANMDRTQQIAVSAVADALKDAGLTPEALQDKRVGTVIGNSMGGEKTDQYATRVSLPSALEALGEALDEIDLSQGLKKDLLGSFKREYLRQLPEITEDSLPGELPNIIAGRVANVFNLTGPNFTVDAACASSIAAVMNGISLLRSRSADLVISGGVDAAMGPSSFIKFCKIGALSPDGSRPFDAAANGFVMGEGAGIMVLKRLEDAVKDRDRVYGLIVGVGSSSDGRGKGITAPNAEGQKRAIRNCLESSGVDLKTIGLVEAHGTSTAVGDKTELMVLDELFRGAQRSKGSVGLGSVKSLIGHLKAAAGAAGMIKAILALHNKTLPPTANVKDPNPCIDWNDTPLRLISEPMDWPNGQYPRRASASAFGFGGANFHVILQEYSPEMEIKLSSRQVAVADEIETETMKIEIPDWPTPKRMVTQAQSWCFGAKDYDDFALELNELEGKLTESNWSDLAVQSTGNAMAGPLRCGFATSDYDDSIKKIKLLKEALKNPRKRSFLPARGIHLTNLDEARIKAGVALIFPGQGSQYTYMLRDLADRFPVVAQTLMEADKTLESLGVTKATSLMFPDTKAQGFSEEEHESAMRDTKLLQPLILTANVAIFRALCHMGLDKSVSVVAGHSLGEYAACVAAGVMSLEDALRAVSVRGKEMANVSMSDPGCMMSVPAQASFVEDVLSRVNGYVVAANKNSPKQTVISGETPAVRAAAELFKEKGLDAVLVPVSAAFHSAVVASAREPFMKTLKGLDVSTPKIPVISNVTGGFYPVGPGAADQIRDLLAKQFAAPVEWIKTIRRMYNEGVRIFVECGPKRVLTALGRDTLDKDALFLATNHPKKGGVVQLLETAAALKAEGIDVDINMEAKVKKVSGEILTESKSEEDLRGTIEQATNNIARHSAEEIDGNGSLKPLMDAELADIVSKPEFKMFMELQGAPIRDFIKSGYANFVEKILPLERTKRAVESQGIDFRPVVVSGMSAGLPGETRFPFDKECLDDLIRGQNFIKRAPKDGMRQMLAKNIERLVKGASGEAELQKVENENDVIRLAGYFSDDRILEEYGVEERMINAMDATTRLALAAGVEALRDARIPLVLETRQTTTGKTLPDAWRLPKPLQEETGVIFASAFPGISSVVDEVTREVMARYSVGAKDRLIKFYTGLIERMEDSAKRNEVTEWFTREFSDLNGIDQGEVYSFNRDFLFRVMTMAPGQLAQFIKAKGPNTHVNAACASTTQAIVMARDWIRTGAAKRVIVVAADDVAGATLLPWVGGGFLAMGAATTQDKVSEAALPFDARRNGVILGSAAVGFVLESEHMAKERGVTPMASIEAGISGNSAFHGTRLDPDHIASLMDRMITRWEKESGHSREDLSKDALFMSHETYSPKRGGSSAAEIYALRKTFGKSVINIPIANTKGFTGHTMGVGVEDAVAMRCLQKGMAPPIPNLKSPDPDFADLKLGPGGPCEANYALRLAAGFGSQIVMSLYKVISRDEDRLSDPETHYKWLKEVTGYDDTETFVEQRILRVRKPEEFQAPQVASESATDLVTDIKKIEKDSSPPKKTVESQETVDSPETTGIQDRIVALLAAKTGYPAEMLDPDLDLEADLGIDTVKQAEFITEVREEFNIPQIKDLKIADFPTVRSVVGFVAEKTDALSSREKPEEAKNNQEKVEPESNKPNAHDEAGPDDIHERILGLLSQKTGYPAEMLDPDLDLEADLGIDTVKQAEFITEVREEFNIPQIKDLKVADFPTIAHILDFVRSCIGEAQKNGDGNKAKETNVRKLYANEEVKVYDCKLVTITDCESVDIEPVDEVKIIGGTKEIAKAVKKAFQERFNAKVQISAELKPMDYIKNKSIGIVNLIPLNPSSEQLTETLRLYMAISNTFESGPVFLITVVSEDGELGFKRPSSIAKGPGAVMGATKAFAREFKNTSVHAIDMSPALSSARQAEEIVKTLTHGRPMEIAIGEDRSVKVLRLVQKMDQANDSSMDEGSVILATGGAKGITAECLKSMARDKHCKFILLGRTQLTPRAKDASEFSDDQWKEERDRIIEAMTRNHEPITPVRVERELGKLRSQADVYTTIKELESLGSEVIYKDIDITAPTAFGAVKDFILESLGENPKLDLIIHGAGIDQSKALKSKTMEQMSAVIGTKLQGLAYLLDGLESANVRIGKIVGFGSVSGRFGNIGQVDYAAANDGLAHFLRHVHSKGIPTKIIDWSPWSNVGMAASGTIQESLEASGIDFISPDKGVEIFKNQITNWSNSFEELVVCGGLGPFEKDAFHIPGVDLPDNLIFAGQKTTVIALIPNEFIRAEVILDPSHPLLDHHRIDGVAVLPGVGGIEMMRSAAVIVSGVEDPEITNVKFTSPLKLFNDEPVKAEVRVSRIDNYGYPSEASNYRVRIVSRFIGPDGLPVGPERVHHQCEIRFPNRGAEKDLCESEAVNGPDRFSSWVPNMGIYRKFFHGPGFRFLNRISFDNTKDVVGFSFWDTIEREQMFKDTLPAYVEAVFQASASLAMERTGAMALPIGLELCAIHKDLSKGVSGVVRLKEEYELNGMEGRIGFKMDAAIHDADNQVVAAFRGVELASLSDPESIPPWAQEKIYEETLELKEVEEIVSENDKKAISRILNSSETDGLNNTKTHKRKVEWLGGRLAAKRAINRLLVEAGKPELPMNSVALIPDQQGKPVPTIMEKDAPMNLSLTISHSNGAVIAAVSASPMVNGIGVDIEKVEKRNPLWERDYFSEKETNRLKESKDRDMELTMMWSIKEAVLKSVGTGLRYDMRDICVKDLGNNGFADLEITGELACNPRLANGGKLFAWAEVRKDTVICRTLLEYDVNSGK